MEDSEYEIENVNLSNLSYEGFKEMYELMKNFR